MAPEYLRGHIIAPPLEYTTQDRLLAEIKVALVELLHEHKRTNELLARLDERDRKRTLVSSQQSAVIDRMAVQVTAIAVQLGRLVESFLTVRRDRGP